ncbi:MAG: hypothetical protein IKN64_09065 [Desulfovibrio sp.]|nr:hypothetical protein [Desulfovibrio sp.]
MPKRSKALRQAQTEPSLMDGCDGLAESPNYEGNPQPYSPGHGFDPMGYLRGLERLDNSGIW